jgi:hypothetical protein
VAGKWRARRTIVAAVSLTVATRAAVHRYTYLTSFFMKDGAERDVFNDRQAVCQTDAELLIEQASNALASAYSPTVCAHSCSVPPWIASARLWCAADHGICLRWVAAGRRTARAV